MHALKFGRTAPEAVGLWHARAVVRGPRSIPWVVLYGCYHVSCRTLRVCYGTMNVATVITGARASLRFPLQAICIINYCCLLHTRAPYLAMNFP